MDVLKNYGTENKYTESDGEKMLNEKSVLITGGTGSFGHHFVKYVLAHYNPKRIIIYSRDEYKQFVMSNEYDKNRESLRFFIQP